MAEETQTDITGRKLSFEGFKREVLNDFRIACISREVSLLGRKEVLTGKAKFGILGDGKELAQIALAKAFEPGDWRSGYYRDQTWMFALGELTVEQSFAQLYANIDQSEEPHSGGRQMSNHFATPTQDENGNWYDQVSRYNSSADASPTACQMPRSLGIALASKLYRENKELEDFSIFSNQGNEVSFVSIGDASTSEGLFWETLNAAGVMKVPLAISVWDDGYGISVPKKYQTTKESISDIISGFRVDEKGRGFDIYVCEGWNYPKLIETYKRGIEKIRKTHVPALFHIIEVTQPQGHSTSGSHERYKSPERLQWEKEFDCMKKMSEWLIDSKLATEEELDEIKNEARQYVLDCKNTAWRRYSEPIKAELDEMCLLADVLEEQDSTVASLIAQLKNTIDPSRKDILRTAKKVARLFRGVNNEPVGELRSWIENYQNKYQEVYSSHLHSETDRNALKVEVVPAVYSEESKLVNGYEVLNEAFNRLFERYPNAVAFGEDVGQIGDVNQGFSGLQQKFGVQRIFDAGIREATIMGQGIGLALRGFRPISEIQYLDYLIYGLQPLVDDLATLSYRCRGIQKAPMIVRTRGHRLEGIWHTGSPMGMIINSLRGMYVCVPRNMTQAAGMYNTLMKSDDPALVIECLNGYRLKEKLPDNVGEFTVPLGIPEVVVEGSDVTLVTYGSCIRVAEDAIKQLEEVGISVELIDVQTLLPFDIHHAIIESVKKTNRLVFLDEDVPGGATAYMMQQVMEEQGAYKWLDSAVKTITATAHRTPYASDGDYFSKPNAEDIFETIYSIMNEAEPDSYPP